MARPHVPKFGTWDANANGPAYTAVFDHARTGKGGKPFNPNDPAENETSGGMMGGPPQRPPARGRMAAGNNDQDEVPSARPRHERRSSREDLDVRKSSDPPGRQPPAHDQPPARRPPGGVGGRGAAEPPLRRVVGDRDGSIHADRGRNEGSGHNNPERSPGHPHAQRVGARESSNRGNGSPAWDRRARQPSGDEGSVFAGQGAVKNSSRLRAQPPRAEEQPAKGGALPKFGAWDVKDPSAGEGFTMIFQKLSNERKEGGPVHIPRLNTDSPARNDDTYHKQNQSNSGRNNQSNNPGCGCTIL